MWRRVLQASEASEPGPRESTDLVTISEAWETAIAQPSGPPETQTVEQDDGRIEATADIRLPGLEASISTSIEDPDPVIDVPKLGTGEPVPAPEIVEAASLRSARDFTGLDTAVRQLPPADSIAATARQLSELASDDWERARAVYVWLTENIAYDADAYFSGRRAVTDPDGVFRTRKSVCQGYAELYREIGTSLGLEIEVVSGYAKGYSYRAGRSFSGTNHAWNVVRLDDAWHQFDATWGAGYVDGRRFVREYSEFWFDPDPDLFVRTHLPERETWQLLAEPTTMDQYLQQPYIASYQFETLCASGFSDEEILELLPFLPEDNQRFHWLAGLADLGFAPEDIVQAVAGGAGVPKAYSYDEHDIAFVEAPLAHSLAVGEEITVMVRAPSAARAAFVDGGNFHYMELEGELFVGTISPARGRLSVNLQMRHNGRTSYWSVLEYEVR